MYNNVYINIHLNLFIYSNRFLRQNVPPATNVVLDQLTAAGALVGFEFGEYVEPDRNLMMSNKHIDSIRIMYNA